jgi:hypothetical protein
MGKVEGGVEPAAERRLQFGHREILDEDAFASPSGLDSTIF